MLAEVVFGVVVSPEFRPKYVVITLAEGTQQTRQPDNRKICPTKKLTILSMPKLMHTDLIAKDEALPFAMQP